MYIYLQVLGNNNKLNTGAKVRLQLFEPPSSNVRSTPNQPEVGHLIFQFDDKDQPQKDK